MFKKKKKYCYAFFALIVAALFLSFFYLLHANYFGTLEIKAEGYSTYEYTIDANTPLYRELHFIKNDSVYYYPYKRFYNKVKITFANTNKDSVSVLVKNDCENEMQIVRNVIENKTFELNFKEIKAYAFSEKVKDLIRFIIGHHLTGVYVIASILFAFAVLLLFLKFKYIIIPFIKTQIEKKYIVYTVSIAVILTVFFISVKNQFQNKIVSGNNPDQIDYYTCAVNFSEGYPFLYGGNINHSIDYKIDIVDNTTEQQHNSFAGCKRLDRFPAYIVLVATILKVFGIEPIAVYIFQWLILCLFVCILPFAVSKVWGTKGFWGSLISAPLLFYYLQPYVFIISPDLITVVVNFYVLFLYILTRQTWSKKYLWLLALLTGLSFLFKASLMLFVVFMWADIFIAAIRRHKITLKHTAGIFVLFLACWVPYNQWSISQALTFKKNGKHLFALIDSNTSVDEINSFVKENKNKFGYYYNDIEIEQGDIIFYNNYIKPELEDKYYPDFTMLKELNKAQRFLFFVKYQFKFSGYFFMTRLYHNGTSMLEVHNEYVNDGNIHPEWMSDRNSYYNNDGLTGKPAILRVAMFYINNPQFIFKLPHFKLKSYLSHNLIVLFLVLIIGLLRLLGTLKMFRKKKALKENAQNIIWIGVITLLMFCALFLNQFVYIYFIFSVFLILTGPYSSLINVPVKFMLLSLLIFPVITYGTQRYLIYYDSVLFVIFGVLLIELFLTLFNFKIIKDSF